MALSVWQRNVVTESGDVIPDAEIEVFDAGEASKPDLFSDPAGTTAITNPFNADTSGFARFYVAGGRYDIAVNGVVTWEDVNLELISDHATETGGIHGIPEDERAVHTADLGPAPDNVPTNQQLADGVELEESQGNALATFHRSFRSSSPSDEQYLLLVPKEGNRLQTSGHIVATSSISGTGNIGSAVFDVMAQTNSDGDFRGTLSGSLLSNSSAAGASLVELSFGGETWLAVRFKGNRNPRYFYFTGVSNVLGNASTLTVAEEEDVSDVAEHTTDESLYFGRPGDIVESGSNDNGHYVRWENGEQVCFRSRTTDANAFGNGSFSNPYRSAMSFNYPAEFSSPPKVSGFAASDNTSSGARHLFINNVAAPSTTSSSLEFTLVGDGSSDSDTWTGYLVAWGFWK